VTRREILHQVLSVGSFDMNRVPSRARGHIEGPALARTNRGTFSTVADRGRYRGK
jgi:hypothetical protein